jgi:hypothetical protein
VNREEAIDKASNLVTEWTDQVKNQRGYVHDKWSPVDLEARTEAVLRIAEFLLVPTGPLVAPDAPEMHVHRASCDGAIGEHLCGYP